MIKIRKLLIIGFVWPEPKSSAAGTRMMQLIDLFLENKFEITFATTAQNVEFSEILVDKRISTKNIDLNSSSFDEFIVELQPDFVLFDRFMVEEQFGWRVSENCSNAIKILNTEDLHSLRNARQEAIKQNKIFEIEDLLNSDMVKREIAAIYRCDVSLFVSDFEIELLKNTFKLPEKLLFYLPLFARKSENILGFESRNDFVFIGNFLHEPNWDAVLNLKKNIWPIIRKKLPEAKMMIYGAYCSQKVYDLHNPKENFFVIGRAENANEIIENAKVVLAPISFGAGIKGKLLEAMQCGTPSITTTIGAEGIIQNLKWNGFVADNSDDFATKAVELYLDETIWNQSQQNGYKIIEKRFSKKLFEIDFKEMIDNFELNYKQYRKDNFVGSMLQYHLNMGTKYMSKWIEEKNKKK